MSVRCSVINEIHENKIHVFLFQLSHFNIENVRKIIYLENLHKENSSQYPAQRI